MKRINTFRVGFLVVIGVSIVIVGSSIAGSPIFTETTLEEQSKLPLEQRKQLVSPRENVTVISKGHLQVRQGVLVAFGPEGRLIYYDVGGKGDIDPSPRGTMTILGVGHDTLSKKECSATTICVRNKIMNINLSTGEETVLYSHIDHGRNSKRWHDVDRINDSHYLVADIADDRVFIVNITSRIIEWEWEAQSYFSLNSGGTAPKDWTHLNDVEYIDDGQRDIMASVRNQDRVVFINKSTGVIADWTIGEENNYSILYEQHNPDYIPAERGGPSVVISDSENNRVVEYQRIDDSWVQTWWWSDSKLLWPRDADRLPNGHTLITDSNGGRVLEVDKSGDIVWNVPTDLVGIPYEAERLGTGDESTNGQSATRLGLSVQKQSRTNEQSSSIVYNILKRITPSSVINMVAFAVPGWVTALDIVAALAGILSIVGWTVMEFKHRYDLRVRSPLYLD